MRWVTWAGVKIDRIASVWLIRRFIDPQATIGFIAPYANLADGDVPFDIPGARYSHHGGCATFRALCEAHGLDDGVLRRIAAIIDAADADGDPHLHPEAAGLDAVCAGLAPVLGSDEEAVRIGAVLFDALYEALRAEEGEAGARQSAGRGR